MKTFQILQYKNRKGETVELGHPEEKLLPLETRLLGHEEPLEFQIERLNPNLFVGHAQVGAVQITKTMEIDAEKYLINFKVVATGHDDRFIGLSTALTEEVEPIPTGTLLHPQYQKQEFYVDSVQTHDRIVFGKEDAQKSWSQVKLASVGSQYFTQAIVDKSPIMPEAKASLEARG